MTVSTPDLLAVLARIGIEPRDISLYQTACIHRSFLNESDKSITEHNERLEFLWDAALELAMTDLIFRKYPEKDEGWMTDLRSSYVRGVHLAELALQYGLDEVLQMSLWERNAGGQRKPNILADMFEAIVWALYLDQGFDAILEMVDAIIFQSDKVQSQMKDAKSLLQELIQQYFVETPGYIILEEVGKDHEKTFTIAATVQWVTIGVGVGTNKKKAQELAAQDALQNGEKWEYLLRGEKL
jgi:ribonuclease III